MVAANRIGESGRRFLLAVRTAEGDSEIFEFESAEAREEALAAMLERFGEDFDYALSETP